MLRQLRYLLLIFLTATTGAVHAQDVLPRPKNRWQVRYVSPTKTRSLSSRS